MAKLIITMDGGGRREYPLSGHRLVIGRATHNDVVIDHPGISAEHAAIDTISNDAFLQDLGSTNGTRVNGQPVMRHFLQDGDVIELADCEMRYAAMETPMDIHAGPGLPEAGSRGGSAEQAHLAARPLQLKMLTGASAGKTFALAKPLVTIGKPGIQVAAIAAVPEGPVLLHVEGACFPHVNGRSAGEYPCRLQDGDVLELSGMQIQLVCGEA